MKKMLLIGLGVSTLLLSFGAWHWLQNDTSNSMTAPMPLPDKSVAEQSMLNASHSKHEHAEHAHGSGLHVSPFELAHLSHEALAQGAKQVPSQPQNMAALPEQEVTSPAEAERTKKLQELGYMLPPEYYSKDLKTLRRMAKAGDAFAMMHIGEKYYFEMQGQTQHPDFEKNMDYAKAAKQSFQDALAAGNIRSAGIIAELYFQEKNPTEAYAWHLVSDQLGDSISAEWFRRTEMAMQASDAVKQAAATRAAQILAELKLKKKTG
ncbi:hypothetical protein [Undibacterium sp.]|uniref:hypothetical protein n=1 Tax=Undibacterium sp. TaxID=1914977 RepID=UPI003753C697